MRRSSGRFRRCGSCLLNIIVQFVQRYLALDGERNQPVNEVGITYAARLPKQWEHADVGEAWHRVDLIKQDSSVLGQKEVHSSHTSAVQDLKCSNRQPAHCFTDFWRN